ncbi:cell division ATP-binding protein FtsE [Sphingoaurantiacus capsulatus]|uniref:Cell division ATP-binding protein FtsE n=1 Tax=Sphingoaurantiacus capsulatus TaxID=1771310 RepID=A0ABV7X6L4_9SPHN
MSSVVRFENVGLRYGTGAEVLRDLSFALDRGSMQVLLGSSGAGKTSLLKLIYLAQRPTRGFISTFDEEVTSLPREALPALRRRIGVVFQDFRLVPHLSAFDNVALPLRIAGRPEDEVREHVEEMLEWVSLTDRMSARPAILSGGEQQRVAVARAVIGRPDLLVADEPTGNIDPEMADRLLHLFQELNKLGTTIVIATHDAHLVSQLPGAKMLRLAGGTLSDPTGSVRAPPAPFRPLRPR